MNAIVELAYHVLVGFPLSVAFVTLGLLSRTFSAGQRRFMRFIL